ncbi:NAD-dependent epimerase/dehydratase family protein [Caulobacter sp. DWR2-3-1b2]|uniref:NAD-dependent epimerase/dehydratase family protein n=1 Tax=Caulobacter sp. DWR2-3-1b2 TaxID=2804642 RepID=UPI003CE80492
MSVLVLGGTGFIGGPLVARLLADGVETVVVHHGRRAVSAGARSLVLDRGDTAAVLAAVREIGATTVIDLLAYTAADTLPLLDALVGQVERYVMASSIDVYANYEGLHRKGRPSPIWDRLTEDGALRASRHPYRLAKPRPASDPQAWMDDYDKIPLEEAARAAAGLEATILRLPMVFGPGDRQRRFSWAIRPMVQGRARFNITHPWAAWRATFGYVDDVAAGIALAAVHPRAGGQTYNLGRANTPTNLAWAATFAEHLGWPGEVELVHPDVARGALAAAVAGLDLSYPLFIDNAKIRRRLGFSEVTELDDALARTVADELGR